MTMALLLVLVGSFFALSSFGFIGADPVDDLSVLEVQLRSLFDPQCPVVVRQASHRRVKSLLYNLLQGENDNEDDDALPQTFFVFEDTLTSDGQEMASVRREAGCLNGLSFIDQDTEGLARLSARNARDVYANLESGNSTTDERRSALSRGITLRSGYPDPFLLVDGADLWLACPSVGETRRATSTKVARFRKAGSGWRFKRARQAPHRMCNEGRGLHYGRDYVHVKTMGSDTGSFGNNNLVIKFFARGLGAKYRQVRAPAGPIYVDPSSGQLHEKCGMYMLMNGMGDAVDATYLDALFQSLSDPAQVYMTAYQFYTQRPAPLPKYQSMSRPLDSTTWLLVLASFLAVVTAATIVLALAPKENMDLDKDHHRCTTIIGEVILLFWGVTFCENHSKMFLRGGGGGPRQGVLLRILWLLAIFFLTMAYSSTLKASMVKLSYEPRVADLSEVVEADAPIYVISSHGFLEQWASSPFEDERRAREVVLRHKSVFTSYFEALLRLIKMYEGEERSFILTVQEGLHDEVQRFNKMGKPYPLAPIRKKYREVRGTMSLPKFKSTNDLVASIAARVEENGIMVKLGNEGTAWDVSEQDLATNEKLGTEHFLYPFGVFFGVYALGILALLCEVASVKFGNCVMSTGQPQE